MGYNCFCQVQKPAAHIIESADQGTAFITELENEDGQRMVNLEEFEIRIIEAGKAGSVWDTRTVLPMQMTEHALTVRIVNLKVGFHLKNLDSKP